VIYNPNSRMILRIKREGMGSPPNKTEKPLPLL
jgi:hypothetical protein